MKIFPAALQMVDIEINIENNQAIKKPSEKKNQKVAIYNEV